MKNALGVSFCLLASFVSVQAAEYTEWFNSQRQFDLEQVSITFKPSGTDDFTIEGRRIEELPTPPTGHQKLNLDDDSFREVSISPNSFTYFGVTYNRAFIGSNGYITFESGDRTYTTTLTNHYVQPRISTFYDDWDDLVISATQN